MAQYMLLHLKTSACKGEFRCHYGWRFELHDLYLDEVNKNLTCEILLALHYLCNI